MKSDLQSYITEIKGEIGTLHTEQTAIKQSVTNVTHELSSVLDSMNFHQNQVEDLRNKVETLNTKSNNALLSDSTVMALESKIDSMKQQARDCNLEITNVSERKNSNLVSLLEKFGNIFGCTDRHRLETSCSICPQRQQDS